MSTPIPGHPGATTAQPSFRVTSATFAHPDATSDDRARLALDGPHLEEALGRVRAAGVDAFVLATCLRIEVVSVGCHKANRRVLELLYPDSDLPAPVVRFDRDVVHHLYRVAAGLDSPIVGEPEVLGQFRAALDVSRSHGAAGGMFEKLLQSAVRAGRAARKQLPETGVGSLALVAAALAADAAEVAIFGAGAMAHAAAETLRTAERPPRVTVYARRPDAVAFDADEVRHMSDAPRALASFPVVISATSSKRELFDGGVLSEALSARSDQLLLVDLAMPPDFSPNGHDGRLRYVNLDDLAERARDHQASNEVEDVLDGLATDMWAKLTNHHQVGPVISAILAEARRAVDEEVSRFSGRLHVDDEQLAVLNQLAQTVAHRVLHRPLSYLSSAENGAHAAPILAEVFGVAGDD
jgi:glutamyl-tRNA reductase